LCHLVFEWEGLLHCAHLTLEVFNLLGLTVKVDIISWKLICLQIKDVLTLVQGLPIARSIFCCSCFHHCIWLFHIIAVTIIVAYILICILNRKLLEWLMVCHHLLELMVANLAFKVLQFSICFILFSLYLFENPACVWL